MRRSFFLLITLCAGLLVSADARAQGENLLRDPGFEDTNMKVIATEIGEGTTFAVNQSWEGWYTTSPREADWQNRIPNGTGRNNTGAGFVRTGNRSMELSRGFATFTAAVYQTVNVPVGATVRGSAWYVMDISDGAQSQARVGIHPNGGTNPFDSAVRWSDWGGNQPVTAGWRELSVQATSTANRVTIFLYTTQRAPTERNGIFWDDASLVITAQADDAAQPTPSIDLPPAPADEPRPTAVQVTPVAPNPDGSIVHPVRDGETTSSIARAYGVGLNTVLELNPVLGDGSLIRPGQLITILPSANTQPPTPTPRPPVTFTPEPTIVAQAAEPEGMAICVMVYEDVNDNRLREDDEPNVAGANVLLEHQGETMQTATTSDDSAPLCFDDLVGGLYTLIVEPPPDYSLLSSSRRLLNLQSDGRLVVNFPVGAMASQPTPTPEPTPEMAEIIEAEAMSESDRRLQIIGLILAGIAGAGLLAGLGIVYFLGGRG
ncbi:MAG: LysM peptidoglycan-binding domain-containing protein [Anaerolineaceae bacterium]|nr:MAG: LysM peptidoglycan-binding domain-containing protein [Anaerolineaceae bacterium]